MITPKIFLWFFVISVVQPICATSLAERFKQNGYLELCNTAHGSVAFDALYTLFDEFIAFLESHPVWAQKLYQAKERFIRSKSRNYYSTNFFGVYDESKRKDRCQISFYYATLFHEYIFFHYPECKAIPEINNFLQACYHIQEPYKNIFNDAAAQIGVPNIFLLQDPPILLKVVKYLPEYSPTKPHYDGTAFSLFLDSTDNQSLLFAPYKSCSTVADFTCPLRTFTRDAHQSSMLLIPGAFLAEFSIYPTPHIVTQNNTVRYALIAFAMRPNYIPGTHKLFDLPNFKH